jgi:hypothetical protein
MLLRDGGRLIGVGVAVGLVPSCGFSRVLGAMIFKIQSFDPTAFVAACLILGFVGILATIIPSIRLAA